MSEEFGLFDVKKGDSVIYHDHRGMPWSAKIREVHYENGLNSPQFVTLSLDGSQPGLRDSGFVTELIFGVSHKSSAEKPTCYWRRPGEAPKEVGNPD